MAETEQVLSETTVSKAPSTYYERNKSKSLEKDVLYKIVSGKAVPTLRTVEKYNIPHEKLHLCLQNLKVPILTKSRLSRLNKIEELLGLKKTELPEDILHPSKASQENALVVDLNVEAEVEPEKILETDPEAGS